MPLASVSVRPFEVVLVLVGDAALAPEIAAKDIATTRAPQIDSRFIDISHDAKACSSGDVWRRVLFHGEHENVNAPILHRRRELAGLVARFNPFAHQCRHLPLSPATIRRAFQFQTHIRALAARRARSRAYSFRPRGRGECRVPDAPAASRAMKKARERVTAGSPESPGIPARDGFNGFLRALPGDRALLPPSSAELLPPT